MQKMQGTLKILNTIEELRELDRQRIMDETKDGAIRALESGQEEQFLKALQFKCFVYADLKKHRYYYHFFYPALVTAPLQFDLVNDESLRPDLQFIDGIGIDPNEVVVGWPLRNLLTWQFITRGCHHVDVQCVGGKGQVKFNGRLLRIYNPKPRLTAQMMERLVGWERNEQDRVAPRVISLAPLMDKAALAREATELNLRLIKWRLLPEIDLPRLMNQRILLLGSGTLGCNLARLLVGWGVKNITFVDNGRISPSNPVRQSLFRWEDAGRAKALTAASRLREVTPLSEDEVKGLELDIPMPGHRIEDPNAVRSSIETLWNLIDAHDAIFLLTDSRESRWLPTVLGAITDKGDKLVMTVALGFDSFVVLRHGTPQNGLACYFCSDIRGPVNTLAHRTLDQQCTVTRPGVSMAAAGWAVELWASLVQHPKGAHAPSVLSPDLTQSINDANGGSCLGAVPHQVRGFLGHLGAMQLTGNASSRCPACSLAIREAIKGNHNDQIEEIMQMLADPQRMMNITGAQDSLEAVALDDVVSFDTEDEFLNI